MNQLFKTDYEQKMKKPYTLLGGCRSALLHHDIHYLYLLRRTSVSGGGGITYVPRIYIKKIWT